MSARTGSLCSGYEGLGMAVTDVLGGELAWVADNDKGAAAILTHRFPDVPNLGDISETDWTAVERVDILTAGFPCQDVSCAGARAGLRAGNRTGVWAHVAEAINALRPSLVVLENVGGLLSESADSDMELCPWCLGDADPESAMRALGAVLADLAEAGFDAEWRSVRASDVGAPHRRERVFIIAWPAADTAGERAPAAQLERQLRSAQPPVQDPDRAARCEWRQSAPGQAPGRRSRADACGPGGAPPTADPECDGLEGLGGNAGPGTGRQAPAAWRLGPAGSGGATADADCGRLESIRLTEPAGQQSARRDEPHRSPPDRQLLDAPSWGDYEPAIRRWESVLGRPAPRPTEPGRTGERLSPRFVEWMMGLPDGWVTDVPGLSRNAQLKALGNGVVPAQAAAALRLLLADALEAAA